LLRVTSSSQLAGIHTKALQPTVFHAIVFKLNLVDIFDSSLRGADEVT